MANTGVSAVFLSRPEEGHAAGHLMSKAGEVAAPEPPLPSNSTPTKGCANGDLMDSFGIFLQGLLGVVAFSTLMCKLIRNSQHGVEILFYYSVSLEFVFLFLDSYMKLELMCRDDVTG